MLAFGRTLIYVVEIEIEIEISKPVYFPAKNIYQQLITVDGLGMQIKPDLRH